MAGFLVIPKVYAVIASPFNGSIQPFDEKLCKNEVWKFQSNISVAKPQPVWRKLSSIRIQNALKSEEFKAIQNKDLTIFLMALKESGENMSVRANNGLESWICLNQSRFSPFKTRRL